MLIVGLKINGSQFIVKDPSRAWLEFYRTIIS